LLSEPASGKKLTTKAVRISCISRSGQTFGIFVETQFWVFNVHPNSTSRQRCVGIFSSNGYLYGQDKHNLHEIKVPPEIKVSGIACAAVSDEFVAIGSGRHLMVLSIEANGKLINEPDIQADGTNWKITRLLFDKDGNELVAIFTNLSMKEEEVRIYSGPNYWGQLASNYDAIKWSMGVIVDSDYGKEEYVFSTRHAEISQDGRKIALCSHHVQGQAVIHILIKEGAWRFWGTQQIAIHSLDNRDWNLPGFTGISLYVVPVKFA
jgi:hypothetical protein